MRVRVAAESPYEVTIGSGVRTRLLAEVGQANRVAILHAGPVASSARELAVDLPNPKLIELPDAEAAKTSQVLASVWEELAEAGFTRSDTVVGLGGGATTDLAGFVAATWLRGVRYVSVPTTLLGMVDAAVGGKTGINLPSGKNLVGAFWEPAAVLCDLEYLQTLPVADLRGGLAEMIKHGFIADPRTLEIFESNPTALLDPSSPELAEAVHRSIEVKAAIVSADLREATSQGKQVGRELLNYGHTLGHAIEANENYRWRHGEAVAVGLVYAAELSRELGRLDEPTVARHRRVIESVGLPTTYPKLAWPKLRAAMNIDKKARGASVRFVLLDAVADPYVEAGPPEDALLSAWEWVGS